MILTGVSVSQLFSRVGFMLRLAFPAGVKLIFGSSASVSHSIAAPRGKMLFFASGFNTSPRIDTHWPVSSQFLSLNPHLWPESCDRLLSQA